MVEFLETAVKSVDSFVFGRCPRPVRLQSGLVIGDGSVYPELNFTLSPTVISAETMPDILVQYREMLRDACERAIRLDQDGLIVEFELLPEMTRHPKWGGDVTAVLKETLDGFAATSGLKSALRVTPSDVREFERPPRMRDGEFWDAMLGSFEVCAREGAELLSIESTGGKEIHDTALLEADLESAIFAVACLGGRDMAYLWDHITEIAGRYGAVPAGDSACGFSNTAMTLAEGRYLPRVWAALDRVLTVPRSLVALQHGAVGPTKDCAYEGPYLKAITGCPVSLEGSEAACAHFSPIGNISRAVADLWSNESVQNVKLLGGMAPTVSLEQLVYATRLMNAASAKGPEAAQALRDLFVVSDARRDPQAYVLRPDVVLEVSEAIVGARTTYERTRVAALKTLEMLRTAHENGDLDLEPRELTWLQRLSRQADALPEDEAELIASVVSNTDASIWRPDQYGIDTPAGP
jgi:methanol--5-hydroxybenzimidazolylcobamide Co-methyltransferase